MGFLLIYFLKGRDASLISVEIAPPSAVKVTVFIFKCTLEHRVIMHNEIIWTWQHITLRERDSMFLKNYCKDGKYGHGNNNIDNYKH